MTAIFGFLIFLLFCVFVAVGIIAFNLYRSYRALRQKFSDLKNGTRRRGRSYGGTATADDEIIIDRRTPDEANRKIFSKNEGEYIDFEEEKR